MGQALQFASEKLRDDWRIVMMAVSQNCLALQYASHRLCGDREIVMAAVLQDVSEGLQGGDLGKRFCSLMREVP